MILCFEGGFRMSNAMHILILTAMLTTILSFLLTLNMNVVSVTQNPIPESVSEPATMLLLGSCLIGFGRFLKKFKKYAA